MSVIWSNRGGWSSEEEEVLLARFGDDTTLDIIARSATEPQVVVTWVEWDRQHPSIYVVDFRARTKDGYVIAEEYLTMQHLRESAWGAFIPPAQTDSPPDAE